MDFENLNLASIKDNKGSTTSNFNLNNFIPIKKPIYFYQGSLTNPNCSEDVNWVVTQDVLKIARSQLNLIKSWITGYFQENNSRAPKELNGRKLYNLKNGYVEPTPNPNNPNNSTNNSTNSNNSTSNDTDNLKVELYKSKLTKEERSEYEVSISSY